ncbi:hypothetical protein N8I77_000174 [Diaporthe amygdali]|uniref:Phytanoyl-CoA dioxygenase n=1 Tax=Phomopsis amygdali TaxID=1214568 RepID=A0AAD9SQC5_PHOAM|nr:hypothetical protein N8I77_000174 [Diaporthe amygdali]
MSLSILETKTFIPELGFHDKPYGPSKRDPLKVFENNVAAVNEFVKKNLPSFNGLGDLVELQLGDASWHNSLPIFIDSRAAEAKLLDSIPEGVEPGTKVTIMPEYVLDVIEGRQHPFSAFAKYGRYIGELSSCFAPMGRAVPATTADRLDPERLPKPTEDVRQIKRDILEWGYAFAANALSPEQVKIVKTALDQQAAGERKAGIAHIDPTSQMKPGFKPNQRVWNLVNKGDEFLDLLNHPLIDEIIPWYLGNAAHVSSFNANISQPGSNAMVMHRDQMNKHPETIAFSYGLSFMWYMIDTTEERGATRVYPGSHNKNVMPAINTVEGSIAAEAKAGTVMLFDNRVWHATGINTSQYPRPVLLLDFARSYVRPFESFETVLSDEVKGKLTARLKELLRVEVQSDKGSYTGYTSTRPGTDAGRMRVLPENAPLVV